MSEKILKNGKKQTNFNEKLDKEIGLWYNGFRLNKRTNKGENEMKMEATINGHKRIVRSVEHQSGRQYKVVTWNGDEFYPRMPKPEVSIQGHKRIAKRIEHFGGNKFQVHCWNGDIFVSGNNGYSKVN